MLIENGSTNYWLTVKQPGCDCSHTQRGLRNTREYIDYTKMPGHVTFKCNNIICKYEYYIPKATIFIDEPTVLSFLKCPLCLKLNVKLTWVYFEPQLIQQWPKDYHFMYNVHTEDRRFNGSYNVYRTIPDPKILSGAILHSHKQYTISLG